MTQEQSDKYYLEVAKLCAKNSYAKKLQVGAIIVKDGQIMSDGFNGTPSGLPNQCEKLSCIAITECKTPEGKQKPCSACTFRKITTKPEVIHAESNAILKCAKHGRSTDGSTLYITHSPCIECVKLIIQAGIIRVVYLEDYRKTEGLELLKRVGIIVEKFKL